MNIWSVIGITTLILLLYLVRIARPSLPPRVSDFEIERALKADERWAAGGKMRRDVYPFARSLSLLVSIIVLLTLNAAISVYAGLICAGAITIVIGIGVVWLSRIHRSVSVGEWLYLRVRPAVEYLYIRRKYLFFLPPSPLPALTAHIMSEAELLRVIDKATFLDKGRRDLIQSSLEFTGLSVADAMSGRRSVKGVDKAEVLGPLLLDELYRTGRQAFVVTDGGIDEIIGILKLEKLTSLDLKDTMTALKAMSPEVHFIDVAAPITEAMAYLRSAKAPFLVVRDDDDKTAGLLTMDNILRCLFTD